MINSPYINKHGTLNAKLADGVAENAPLWSVEYLLLKHDPELYDSLLNYIHSCKTSTTDGLYHQYPTKHNTKEDYMSPDQLIAFVAGLKMAELDSHIDSIWRYLWTHLFTYDNLQPNKINFNRTMQLSAVLYCGIQAGHFWLKPFLSIALIFSCATNRKETSGKLKAWVMFKTTNMGITEKICSFLIKTNSYLKSWSGVFREYFQEKDHPIRELI